MHSVWKKEKTLLRSLAAPLCLFLLLFIFFWLGTSAVSRSSAGETASILEDAVSRAVVQCYADEGMYPPNVDYLIQHYGLMVDSRHFIVHYEAFASNIFPIIAVIPLDD